MPELLSKRRQAIQVKIGNVVMGVVFALVWRRTRRVAPLVVAHTLIDVVAFLGYAVLHGRVGWL